MRIAEELYPNGVTTSTHFNDALTQLIRDRNLKKIVETGTYHGTGTTRAIIEGQRFLPGRCQFYSIEVNPENHRIAQRNTVGENVRCMLGLSVPSHMKPPAKAIEFLDYPSDIVVDFKEDVRSASYFAEVNYNVKDNLLQYCLEQMDFKPDLVLLDSAGHLGFLEFEYLLTLVDAPFYLALDDTGHVKHFKTVQKILKDDRFTLVFETPEKFGSSIFKVSANRSHRANSQPR